MDGQVKNVEPQNVGSDNIFKVNGITEQTEVQSILESTLNGYGSDVDFDDNSNVIDKEGKVVASATDVEAKLGETIAEFLKSKGTPDPSKIEGNAEDDNNPDKGAKPVDGETSIMKSVVEVVGYTFKDEEGKDIEFPDDGEGLTTYISKVKETIKEEAKKEVIDDLFATDAELVLAYNHYKQYGTLKNYNTYNVSYQNLDINKMDDNQKLASIKELYLVKGLPEAQINGIIGSIKPGETLNSLAADAVNSLKKIEKERDAAAIAKVADDKKELERQRTDYINNVTEVIKSGKVGDITINEKDRAAFMTYLFTPVKDGKTQEALDYEKLTLDEKLNYSFKLFKNIKDADIAATGAKELNLKQLLAAKKQQRTPEGGASNKDEKGFVSNMSKFNMKDLKKD